MRSISPGKLLISLTILALAACAAMPDSRGNLVDSVQDFSQRLRWKDLNGAAHYLSQEQQEDFRRQFEDDTDLHIVEVRVERVEMPEPGRAGSVLVLQYYRLPSVTVQRQKIDLEWMLHSPGKGLPGDWKIVTPFPDLAAKDVSSRKENH